MTYYLMTDEYSYELDYADAENLLNSGVAELWHQQPGETYLILSPTAKIIEEGEIDE